MTAGRFTSPRQRCDNPISTQVASLVDCHFSQGVRSVRVTIGAMFDVVGGGANRRNPTSASSSTERPDATREEGRCDVTTEQQLPAAHVFRVTMHVVCASVAPHPGAVPSDPEQWDAPALLAALRSGAAEVLDEAVSVRSVGVAPSLPRPGTTSRVLEGLIDGDVAILPSSSGGGPMTVELTSSAGTYRGTGATLEIALGTAVHEAIRGSDRLAAEGSPSVEPASCPDGWHRWIGPLDDSAGSRLLCVRCETTSEVSTPVPEPT